MQALAMLQLVGYGPSTCQCNFMLINRQVYFMVPEPQKALSESLRVLKDGGVLTCSSWEGSSWMDLMALLPRIRPDKIMPKMPKEWENVDLMGEELRKAGFRDVESHRVPTSMKYESLEGLADFMATKMPHMVCNAALSKV